MGWVGFWGFGFVLALTACFLRQNSAKTPKIPDLGGCSLFLVGFNSTL